MHTQIETSEGTRLGGFGHSCAPDAEIVGRGAWTVPRASCSGMEGARALPAAA
jgi:hypothetical protein